MYSNSYAIPFQGSISIAHNNLSILNRDSVSTYAVVGKNAVYLTSAQNGKAINESQIIPKPSREANDNQLFLITEAKFIKLRERTVLVIITNKGIFFYEEDGSNLIHYHPINSRSENEKIFVRGVTGLEPNLLALGTSLGTILIFEISSRSNKISILTEINDPSIRGSITALTSDSRGQLLGVGDSVGTCIAFNLENMKNIKTVSVFTESNNSVTCMCMWQDYLIASFSHGVISIFDLVDDVHLIDINAHARWIYSLDICKDLLVSSGEDCHFRVWQLSEVNKKVKASHLHSGLLTDTLITSAQFNNKTDEICISSFDGMELFVYKTQ
ncbi:unnamed protein product [Brachionus calyciflorus]|uniref:WD repeat-containing protein 54 beta-propeller domain-containing protein n=1 Tax=Brachionus calyciflorus TaxID=104777 RepID=A0A813T0B2_9BILA|nr:unnamed protein product [Brachionus calyciflorus]